MSFIKNIALIVICSLIACTAVSGDDSMDDLVKVKINDEIFDVELENNSATEELIKELKTIFPLSTTTQCPRPL